MGPFAVCERRCALMRARGSFVWPQAKDDEPWALAGIIGGLTESHKARTAPAPGITVNRL